MDIVLSQAATVGVGTDGSLLCSNSMTNHLNCCGESVLQMLAQNKAILSWCGDSGTTTARAIGSTVDDVISILETVDSPDVNVISISNDLLTLSCSLSSNSLFSHGVYIEVMNVGLEIAVCIYTHNYHKVHEHFEIINKCLHLPPTSLFECAFSANRLRLT